MRSSWVERRGPGKEDAAEKRATGAEDWARGYVLLTLRIGKAVEARTGDGWMLDYYGPPEWKALVDAEEPEPGGALLDAGRAAGEALPRQGFETRRTRYLGKHLRALMTVARRLAGERFSLKEQAAGCFDLDVGRIAVERFEEAGDLLDQALPGRGDVRGDIHAYPESGIDPDGDAGRIHAARDLLWGA